MLEEAILNIDASRRTTYQMLEYAGKKVIAKKIGDLLLLKTEPFIDAKYNQVYSLNDDLSPSDLEAIRVFLNDKPYRLVIPTETDNNNFFLTHGFKLKDRSFAMETDSRSFLEVNFTPPDNIKIKKVENEEDLNDFKNILEEAFSCSRTDYERKFGFLKKLVLDPKDKKIKFFLLYENDQAVSSGGYYAFDNFSIESIGTVISARGKGYAGLMVKFLLQQANLLGYSRACLTASLQGASVYEKAGFKITSKNNTYILCAE